MLAILQGDPEAITRRLPIMMIPAIIACFVSGNLGGVGILTGAHLFGFAVLAASMTEYKTDKGLWMLALLFATIWTGLIGLWMYGQFLDLLRGIPFQAGIAIDAFFAMFLMRLMVRFLWKTVKLNYSLSIGSD
ncbi:MAG: hypothetical protein ABL921_34535 [Pirellula sp.]